MICFDQSYFSLPTRSHSNNTFAAFDEQMFFLSFTDGVRYVANKFPLQKNDYILVPDFYCPDTLSHLSSFGTLCFYTTTPSLDMDYESYIQAVKKYKPQWIIHYSLGGFTSTDELQHYVHEYSPEALVIEDYAHQILQASSIHFRYKNHVYMDSIRKQFSLLGSHCISNFKCKTAVPAFSVNSYSFQLSTATVIKHLTDFLQTKFSWPSLHTASDRLFDFIDELVGTHPEPVYGSPLFSRCWEQIDMKQYSAHIQNLMKEYNSLFAPYSAHGIRIPERAKASAHALPYFPVIMKQSVQAPLLAYLQNHNIYAERLWEKPPARLDIRNSLYDTLVIFPLTWTIKPAHIQMIKEHIDTFFESHHA